MTREWLEVIARDVSHPSIITWVPLNESWGVQHISHDPAQLDYARSLYHLTKSLDPSRPVISNDGWEHADSDLWTIHDYGVSGSELAANYADQQAVEELLSGISFAPTHRGQAWGYVTVTEVTHLEKLLRELFEALQASPVLAGFCYTQLTDTRQEANGLTDPHRRPKLPVETIRSIVHGESLDTSGHRRPKKPVERLSISTISGR